MRSRKLSACPNLVRRRRAFIVGGAQRKSTRPNCEVRSGSHTYTDGPGGYTTFAAITSGRDSYDDRTFDSEGSYWSTGSDVSGYANSQLSAGESNATYNHAFHQGENVTQVGSSTERTGSATDDTSNTHSSSSTYENSYDNPYCSTENSGGTDQSWTWTSHGRDNWSPGGGTHSSTYDSYGDSTSSWSSGWDCGGDSGSTGGSYSSGTDSNPVTTGYGFAYGWGWDWGFNFYFLPANLATGSGSAGEAKPNEVDTVVTAPDSSGDYLNAGTGGAKGDSMASSGTPVVEQELAAAPMPPKKSTWVSWLADKAQVAVDTAIGFQSGIIQGELNVLNRLQDAIIGTVNLGIQTTPAALIGRALGNPAPEIPSLDWSKDKVVQGDPTHDASKFIGGESALLLITVGAGEVLNAARAAGASGRAAAGVGEAADAARSAPSTAAKVLAESTEKLKAASGNVVYRSVNAAGEVQYVGITNNFARRAAEHLAEKGIQIEKLMGNLSRSDAQAVEQALIEIHRLGKDGGTLLNKINSIARSNPIYADQLRRGLELLESIGY